MNVNIANSSLMHLSKLVNYLVLRLTLSFIFFLFIFELLFSTKNNHILCGPFLVSCLSQKIWSWKCYQQRIHNCQICCLGVLRSGISHFLYHLRNCWKILSRNFQIYFSKTQSSSYTFPYVQRFIFGADEINVASSAKKPCSDWKFNCDLNVSKRFC